MVDCAWRVINPDVRVDAELREVLLFEFTGGEEDFCETGVTYGSVEVSVIVRLVALGDEDEAGGLAVVTRADDRAPHVDVGTEGVVEVYGDEEHKKKCEPPHCQQVARSLGGIPSRFLTCFASFPHAMHGARRYSDGAEAGKMLSVT